MKAENKSKLWLLVALAIFIAGSSLEYAWDVEPITYPNFVSKK